MEARQHSNRSLAAAAGVSEGAVRNILKYGEDPKARGSDARTLMDKSFKDGRIDRGSIVLHKVGFKERFVQVILKV